VELTVATQTAPTEPATPAGFAAVSRVVVSAAADLVTGVQRVVVGPAKIRTARDNAWDAILADRARNAARDELIRQVAVLSRSRWFGFRRGALGRDPIPVTLSQIPTIGAVPSHVE
jgi:hypothetical protein